MAEGAINEFERHSRLGFVDQESFVKEVERLRALGAKRVTLKTGAYPMRELAMAIRWSSEAKIDLLTIDGAPGGTGMSPWRMMCEWGIPSIYLHSMAYELCERLAKKGAWVPDIAFAGGFSSEDHIFKALSLGAPHVKAVCMGRGLMIPGMVGKNIDRWLSGGRRRAAQHCGQIRQHKGRDIRLLRRACGPDSARRRRKCPWGPWASTAPAKSCRVGLQQLMAGARKWRVDLMSRKDLACLTEECAKVTGLPYIMEAYRQEALDIIDS